MSRRILYLYFPSLAIDRLERDDPQRKERPIAVACEEKAHQYVLAVNVVAARAGISSGMRIADARALSPQVEVASHDEQADGRVHRRLIEWCGRYTPIAAGDGLGGIVLDITGCAHLFGGEQALLADIERRIKKAGFRTRGAIANTLGAAWGLARYSKQTIVAGRELVEALDRLPIEALRIPEDIAADLGRVGITTVRNLRAVERDALTKRYSQVPVLRLGQALGGVEEPVTPHRPPPLYATRKMLAEPIGTTSAVEYVIRELVRELCVRLETERLGARQLELACYRVDGKVVRCRLSMSKPARSVKHILRLFIGKLDSIDAGFGIETLILSALLVDAARAIQLSLPEFGSHIKEESPIDVLVDRIGAKLGFGGVSRVRVHESLLPEYAAAFTPVTAPADQSANWPSYRVRPMYLVDPPVSIEAIAPVPDEPPIQIRIGRRMHRVVRSEGPERLTPEWWRDQRTGWHTRDYYRVEDESGSRFWVFRDGLYGPSQSPRWFLHGYFA